MEFFRETPHAAQHTLIPPPNSDANNEEHLRIAEGNFSQAISTSPNQESTEHTSSPQEPPLSLEASLGSPLPSESLDQHDSHSLTQHELNHFSAKEESLSSISSHSTMDTLYPHLDTCCEHYPHRSHHAHRKGRHYHSRLMASAQPLLSSPLIMYHIVKFLDLPSNLSASLVCRDFYLAAASDRVWSRYIVKSAKRGKWNWHIAWGAEPCWWMKSGENIVTVKRESASQPHHPPISHDTLPMTRMESTASQQNDGSTNIASPLQDLTNSQEVLRFMSSESRTAYEDTQHDVSDFSGDNSDTDDELIQQNQLVHGYADYVPCLISPNASIHSKLLGGLPAHAMRSTAKYVHRISSTVRSTVSSLIPSFVFSSCTSGESSQARMVSYCEKMERGKLQPTMSSEVFSKERFVSMKASLLHSSGNFSKEDSWKRTDNMEYSPDLTLQYWKEDFASEEDSSLVPSSIHASQTNTWNQTANSPSLSHLQLSDIELRDQSVLRTEFAYPTSPPIPSIPGHGVKQSYALFKKTLRHEVELRKFQSTMHRKGEEIDHFVKYRIKPCMWTSLISFFFCVGFWTHITAPMLWDNIIPKNGLWWLIPYAGNALFVLFFIIVLGLELFFTGWIPGVSYFVKKYCRGWCEKLQALLQSSQSSLVHYLSYWFDPWHARDIESRFLSILGLHLLFVPTLIICIGVNQLFFDDESIMSYVIIPTYACFLGSILDFARRLLFSRKGRYCHVKVVHFLLLLNMTLIYGGIAATIGLAASKRDGHQVMKSVSWTIISIPIDISMAFLILNISFFRGYMIIRDAKYRYHQCGDWIREALFMILFFCVTSLLFIGCITVVVLLPLKMDGTLDIPYSVVMSPIPLTIAVVTTLFIGLVCCACSFSFVSQFFKRNPEVEIA